MEDGWRRSSHSNPPHAYYFLGFIQVWDMATGDSVYLFDKGIVASSGLAFSPDGRRLAGTDWQGKILIWDMATGLEIARLDGDSEDANSLAFSADGSMLACATPVGVKVWDAGLLSRRKQVKSP